MLDSDKDNQFSKLVVSFRYYLDRIAPLYSYFVALKAQKPVQVLTEIENTFAHMAQAVKGIQPDNNLEKAQSHLIRLEIDLCKLLIVEILAELNKNSLRDSIFIKYSKNAREAELSGIGSEDREGVITAYITAINYGLEKLKLDPVNFSEGC